ncbi:MAG: MgtC/SapB family protein [Bacteroidetes bacterium]|nr:MgtC/SapB family protein [Bacteroidota bacterium]
MNLLLAFLQSVPPVVPDTSVVELFQKGAVCLLIGALVGIERERSQDEHRMLFAGIRTFPLIALLGFLSAVLGHAAGTWTLGVFASGFLALVVVSYFHEARDGSHGATSEVAAIIVFLLGVLVQYEFYAVSIASAVVLTLFLTVKGPLQKLVARVQPEDMYATLKFAIITAIVLPLLPDTTFGPLDVLNPRQIWYMVVLIAGISFLGYVTVKILGPKRGLTLTGLTGGLVSSTAVTLSFSQKSKEAPDLAKTFASSIVLACSIMFPRILIEIAVVNPSLLAYIWPHIAILTASGVTASLVLLLGKKKDTITDVELKNPFELMTALKFGLVFALIIFVSKAAQIYLGDGGVYLAAGLSGLTDVDAITLSMANLSKGAMSESTATVAILIAAVVNTAVKAGIAWSLGAAALRRYTLPGFGLVLLTGLVLIFVLLLA